MVGQPLTQTKTKRFLRYIFALLLGFSFFSYEFLPNFSESYYKAQNEALEAKKLNTEALAQVKNYAKGTTAYENYLNANEHKKIAFQKFNRVKEDEKVFGFRSFQLFWERLGLFLGIFIYALYNLYRSFYFESENIGSKIIHGFIISVCMFYFFWIFQAFQDVTKITYYLMTFLSAGAIVFAV